MRVIELHTDSWVTAVDFVTALKVAIGRPIGMEAPGGMVCQA
jgi:hypothetical protein